MFSRKNYREEADLEPFCDLHLHVIPGIDDGARTLEASLEMLSGLNELGFNSFVATPHLDDHRFTYGRKTVYDGFAALQSGVAAAGLPIELNLGAEYTYGPRFYNAVQGNDALTLAGSRYVLVELPEPALPANMPDILFNIATAGYYPVLAHPERCKPFHNAPRDLESLATGRALIQVSFRSLAGTFGRSIKKTAWTLVEEGIADLTATDCHHPKEINKVVAPVLNELCRRLPEDRINRLMSGFPRSLIVKDQG